MHQEPNNFDQLLEKTFAWLEQNTKNFAIKSFVGSTRVLDLVKPIGELVLASAILKKLLGSKVSKKTDNFLNFAWEQLNKGRVLEEILISRPDFLILTSIYGTFKSEGFISKKLESEIQKIANTPGFLQLDLPAWRQLDLIHGLNQVGVIVNSNIKSIYSRTWLAGHHAPWTITNSTAYGVTHTVFYLTDYGSNPEGLAAKTRSYLVETLPIWTDYYLREENYDLAAEMVMASFCIGIDSLDQQVAFRLSKGQLSDGAISAPQLGAVNLLFGEGNSKRRYFLTHYHTTIVSCVAAAMFSSYRKVWKRA